MVVLAGALLDKAEGLLKKDIHPSIISEGYQLALLKAVEIINSVAKKIDPTNDEQLIQCVKTSLSSKFLSQNSTEIAPLAIKAIKKIADISTASNVDLNDIKIVKKVGGTVDDI